MSINLNTLEVEPFTAFDKYNSVNQHKIVDGSVYLWAFNQESDGTDNTTILRKESFGDYTEITKV
ncbi:MAG: hypothetical protein AAF901_14650, partial [Bacteroidota bacterium]